MIFFFFVFSLAHGSHYSKCVHLHKKFTQNKKKIFILYTVGTSAIFQQQDHLRPCGGEVQRNHLAVGKDETESED